MQVNELTAEVSETIGGVSFRLHATIGRMAALETELGVENFEEIVGLLQKGSLRALTAAFRHLCSSGNAEAFDELPIGKVFRPATAALIVAIATGLPTSDGRAEKNGEAARAAEPRGRDTGRSRSAS